MALTNCPAITSPSVRLLTPLIPHTDNFTLTLTLNQDIKAQKRSHCGTRSLTVVRSSSVNSSKTAGRWPFTMRTTEAEKPDTILPSDSTRTGPMSSSSVRRSFSRMSVVIDRDLHRIRVRQSRNYRNQYQEC